MKLLPRRRERRTTMTVVEHLEELRARLLVSIIAVAVGAVGGWLLFDSVMDLLRGPFCNAVNALPKAQQPPTGCALIFSGPVEPFLIKLKVVAFLGLGLALPVVLWEFWAYITPGLTKKERRLAVPFVACSLVLFALGGWLAFLTLPKGLQFLLGFAGGDFVALLSASRYIGFAMLLTLAFGLSFEFPLVLIFLAKVGIVSSRQLRGFRRYAILVIAVFAAVITPSQDPYTMFAMMLPMVIFYEAAILVIRLMKR
jgi:sec-independent protein translocase protein TatC